MTKASNSCSASSPTESIPRIRAVRNWEQEEEEGAIATIDDALQSAGCKFADRCPAVMEKCWTDFPPLYRSGDNQVARRFLYEDRPVFGQEDVAETFAEPAPVAAGVRP